MSKIRYPSWNKYKYFEHCPFCGSVEVDFDHKTFRCPDCGAVVTFDLPQREPICDGASDEDKIIELWNNRSGEEITADDLCIMAQKAERENSLVYQDYIEDQILDYIEKSAILGKYSCEIPAKYLNDVKEYERRKFNVEKKGDNYVVSWRKDIQWD